MANDIEAKRLADWNGALKTYCDGLEEIITELRGKRETVPATDALKKLSKKIIEIENAGKTFRYAVNRAVDSAPPVPNIYDDH